MLGGYGQGLTGAYAPFATGLGTAGQIEALGMEPLNIGAQLGGRVASSTGAQALLSGGLGAARTLQGPMSYSPTAGLLQGLAQSPYTQQAGNLLGQQISGLFGGGTMTAPYISTFDEYGTPNF